MSATTKALHWRCGMFAVLTLLAPQTFGTRTVSAAEPSLPFSRLENVVVEHFRSLPDYQPGAVISRSQVEAVFLNLDRLGWPAADRNAILDRVLADSDWLVQELRSSDGRRFASRIATYSGGYDRLDRLTRLANGRRTVHDLIHGPGGYQMIEYMTQSRGGGELGKMLSKAPGGANFNQPTGRIYTVDGLLDQLKKSYQATQEHSP